ncbi:DUF4336 domain-containing protein [Rhodalgimonas zhirmunskyi]|uniref:DUF4336 domain-containing protein n=1 Tax=Rhodalgimonas zhirmunskyi TaxID=2964767 RepID=A0AAJ1U9V9_9RHOB|nr:DUF4336 domain-containing protein [Rhodoalgimonas zhirmunskyi]MDQ2093918.1 DUF4336 domain-containing protein [Rhodoalgimonas zhirmunskyi]
MTTGYEPLNTLKPVAPDIWVIDGPAIRFYGMPFSTRATVVRLENGALWVHSPTHLTEDLRAELAALGPVAHLIAPNWIHYAHIQSWQAAFPQARAWAAPGVADRAAKHGLILAFDHELCPRAEDPWQGQIEQMIVPGSKIHREAVFFHRASRTLILTDLIENFEPRKLPFWMRPLIWLGGIADPDGQMPRDMRMTFVRHRDALRDAIEQMLAWGPERVILAHGRWFRENGAEELRRAFRWLW